MLAAMWVGVLGPTQFRLPTDVPDAPGRSLPAAKHRALVAALALHGGRPVPADVLVEALWGQDAPPSAHATLHTYLSVVRRALEPDLPARAPSRYVVSTDLGYQLCLREDGHDAGQLTHTVSAVHAELGPLATAAAPRAEDPAAA